MFGIAFDEVPYVYWAVAAGFGLAVLFGLRHRIKAWSDRNEQAKLAWRAEQERQKRDPLAHFYLSVDQIAARTPEPEPAGADGNARWRFRGHEFDSFEDAAEARRIAILTEARSFYQDVDRLQIGARR